MSSGLIEKNDVLRVCEIPEKLLNIIAGSGFTSQLEFNHRRGLKVAEFLNSYMSLSQFKGKRILELGPGHYSFALIARSLGAEVVCVERNTGFNRLGKDLGFQVEAIDFVTDINELKNLGQFDGVWAKGVFNSYNYSENQISSFTHTISSMIEEDGWGFFVTVNKGDDMKKLINLIEFQNQSFLLNGWRSLNWSEKVARLYAMYYQGCSHYEIGSLQIG